jgi:hypothetical protein
MALLPRFVLEDQMRRLRGLPKVATELQLLCSRIVRDVQLDAEEVASGGLPREVLSAAADAFGLILEQIDMCSHRCAVVGEALHEGFMAACVDVLERAQSLDALVHNVFAGFLQLEKHLMSELPLDDVMLEGCLLHVEESVSALQRLPPVIRSGAQTDDVRRLRQDRRELKTALRELVDENDQLRDVLAGLKRGAN